MNTTLIPEISGYKATGTFRFWCQHVLPLVYDDSLSYYELLCKVVDYLNDVISNVDAIAESTTGLIEKFNELKEYVDNYFDNLDVQEEINNKLDEMAEDGTLAVLIGDALWGMPFMPDKRYTGGFKNMAYQCVASYFASGVGLESVQGVSNVPNKVAWVYTDSDKGYMGVLGEGSSGFVYNDTLTINDVEYPVAYIDCSQFLSLITKCRTYENSAYKYAFDNIGSINADTLRTKCTEAGGVDDMPYTFDFLNYIYSARMGYIMDSSGNHLKLVSSKTDSYDNVLEDYFDRLEDCDLLFVGNPVDYPNRYLGLHHVGMYFKTLDTLNQYASQYGITLTDISNGYQSDKGYIVHATGNPNTHINTLRIQTFQAYANTLPSSGTRLIYSCKPYANGLNSNKAHSTMTFTFNDYNETGFGARYGNFNYIKIKPDGHMKVQQLGVNGVLLDENQDLNTLADGLYRCKTTAVSTSLLHKPENLLGTYFDLYVGGTGSGSQNGFQLLLSTYHELAFRTKQIDSTEWTEWTLIRQPNSVPIYDALSFGNVGAGEKKTLSVTFPHEFASTPVVIATLNADNAWGAATLGNIQVSVYRRTTTGCEITVANNSSNALNITVLYSVM